MELKDYGRGVLHVVERQPLVLANAFMRIQESSSNPLWSKRGVFTAKEFLTDYSRLQSQDGRWDYHLEYFGFTVQSSALKPFYSGRFDPLNQEESRLLRLLKTPTNEGNNRSFVIGTREGDTETLDHELSCALFHVDPSYRATTLNHLRGIPKESFARMRQWFVEDGGYLPQRINCEIIAEFVDWTDSYMFKEQHIDRRASALKKVRGNIRETFEEALKTLSF